MKKTHAVIASDGISWSSRGAASEKEAKQIKKDLIARGWKSSQIKIKKFS